MTNRGRGRRRGRERIVEVDREGVHFRQVFLEAGLGEVVRLQCHQREQVPPEVGLVGEVRLRYRRLGLAVLAVGVKGVIEYVGEAGQPRDRLATAQICLWHGSVIEGRGVAVVKFCPTKLGF